MDQVHRRSRQRAWLINHSPKAHDDDARRLRDAKARRDQRLAEEPPKKKEVSHGPITTSKAERLLFVLGLCTPFIAGAVMGLYAFSDPAPTPLLNKIALTTILFGCFSGSSGLGMSERKADRAVAGLKKRFGRRPSQPTA